MSQLTIPAWAGAVPVEAGDYAYLGPVALNQLGQRKAGTPNSTRGVFDAIEAGFWTFPVPNPANPSADITYGTAANMPPLGTGSGALYYQIDTGKLYGDLTPGFAYTALSIDGTLALNGDVSSFTGFAGPVNAYGTSYMVDPAADPTAVGHEMFKQIGTRGGGLVVVTRGVGSTRLVEIAGRMTGSCPAGMAAPTNGAYAAGSAAGRILVIDGTTNDAQFSAGSGSTPTAGELAAAQESVRVICALAECGERIDDTDGRWTYDAAWAAAGGQIYKSGDSLHYTPAAGLAVATCNWVQPAGVDHVYFLAPGSPTAAGPYTGFQAKQASFSVDGGAATTKQFAGTMDSFASAAPSGGNLDQIPVVFKIAIPVSGVPAAHTLTVTYAAAAGTGTVDALLVPTLTPARLSLIKSPPVPVSYGGAAHLNAMLPTFNAVLDAIKGEFGSNVHVIDWQTVVNGVGFSTATMIGADHIHPNHAGENHITDVAVIDLKLSP